MNRKSFLFKTATLPFAVIPAADKAPTPTTDSDNECGCLAIPAPDQVRLPQDYKG